MLAFTPFVQVATYATRHFATFGLAPAAAPICDVLEMSLLFSRLANSEGLRHLVSRGIHWGHTGLIAGIVSTIRF